MNDRTLKQNISIIEMRVQIINEKLDTNYRAYYNETYGTWTMSDVIGGKYSRNNLGFDIGKTMAEMYAYTDGIFRMWDYLRYNDVSRVKW